MARKMLPVFFVCSTCGALIGPGSDVGFHCPRGRLAATAKDHILLREIDAAGLFWPDLGPPNSFLRFRHLMATYVRFRAEGGRDATWTHRVRQLEEKVGAPFRPVSLSRAETLEVLSRTDPAGSVWLASAAEYAGGGRYRRGLLGALLPAWLSEAEPNLRSVDGATDLPEARSLAQSLGFRLGVESVAELEGGDAREGLIFTRALGPRGEMHEAEILIGYEIADQLRRRHLEPDRILLPRREGIDVAVAMGLREAFRLGILSSLPRFHFVDEAASPGGRDAYERGIYPALQGIQASLNGALGDVLRLPGVREEVADVLAAGLRNGPEAPIPSAIQRGLQAVAADHTLPPHGFGLARSMMESAGYPVVVEPDECERARQLLSASPAQAGDGALSVAGYFSLLEAGQISSEETVVLLAL